MKKILSLLLVGVMGLSLCACSQKGPGPFFQIPVGDNSSGGALVPPIDTQPTATEAEKPSTPQETAPTVSLPDLSNYVPEVSTLAHNDTIPEGGTYYRIVPLDDYSIHLGYIGDYSNVEQKWSAGEAFPDDVQPGDIYVYGDFEYRYEGQYDTRGVDEPEWLIPGYVGGRLDDGGWGVRVLDPDKAEYGEMVAHINNKPVVYLIYAFDQCANLVKAPALPEATVDMSYAFKGCASLVKTPDIPKSTVEMFYTFEDCTSLTEATPLPASLKKADGAYSGCTSLTKAPDLSSGIYSMNSTFSNCTSLVEAPVLPDTVVEFRWTFSKCTNLKTAHNIPKYVKDMYGAFSNCESLQEIPALGNFVKDMSSAFNRCSSLIKAPVIPETVTEMHSTFAYCTKLEKAPELPKGVEDLSYAFIGCTNLKTAPSLINLSNLTKMDFMFSGCRNLSTYGNETAAPGEFQKYFIPPTVTEMRDAFNNCMSIYVLPPVYEEFMARQ